MMTSDNSVSVLKQQVIKDGLDFVLNYLIYVLQSIRYCLSVSAQVFHVTSTRHQSMCSIITIMNVNLILLVWCIIYQIVRYQSLVFKCGDSR